MLLIPCSFLFVCVVVLQASKLTVEYTTQAKVKQEKETLKFGATTSDHMLEIDWDAVKVR
jgi:hypothetical protein